MSARQHDRVLVGAVHRVQRDARQVQRSEQVGVAHLAGEADPEDVEGGERPVGVHGEVRDPVLAHEFLQVGPDRVGAFGEYTLAFVEDLVEDLDPLVGHANLIGVGYISAHRTSASSHSLTTEFSSPPTYWIGFCTWGSNASNCGKTDSTVIGKTGLTFAVVRRRPEDSACACQHKRLSSTLVNRRVLLVPVAAQMINATGL